MRYEGRESGIEWGEPFTVEFRLPKGKEDPWEVTLLFDNEGRIILVKQCCDKLSPQNEPGLPPPADCPPGQCGIMMGGRLYCSANYCR